MENNGLEILDDLFTKKEIRLLLVEDNPGDALLIKEMMKDARRNRYTIQHVKDLASAMEAVKAGPQDIILLDLFLPDSYGIETFTTLFDAARKTPIIVLTGLDNETVALESVQRGAQDYLEKGEVTAKQLERAIRYAVERRKIFNRLHASEKSLRITTAQLKEALARIKEELESARLVQKAFLPVLSESYPGINVAAAYWPCGSVGGDLYDIYCIDEYRTAVIGIDVAGHGVPAALTSVATKICFRQGLDKSHDLVDVMRHVDEVLKDVISQAQFVAAFIGMFDCRTRRFTYVRAGLPWPLMLRAEANEVHLLDGTGSVLGMLPTVDFKETTLTLEPGDKIVIYTDGITDGENPKRERYGKTRLEESLQKASNATIAQTVSLLMDDYNYFIEGTSQNDDITILGIQLPDSNRS